ncbi:Ca-activated chloride channel family protein [Mycobacterium sp. MAA66]|uniref:VWA domain-containing protein n=1 Tax=Mycobacterium sp. MAA66 TaxID=3156297 RepID=UPI003514C534
MNLPGIGSVSLSGFAYPWMLLTALLPLALVAAYVMAQRRRASRLHRYAGDHPRPAVVPRGPSRWRHLPMVFSVVGLLLLSVALAAPTHEIKTPRNRAVIMLVIDVSRSMEADDVPPKRLAAAREAAKQFTKQLTPGVNLGLVSFSGNTNLLVSPTPDHQATLTALDNLKVDDGTATGDAIFAALRAVGTLSEVLSAGNTVKPPARIVLLSDGAENRPSNHDSPHGAYTAARSSKEQGVPISTITFGTKGGSVKVGNQTVPVPVDDTTMKKVAELSGGQMYTAARVDELNRSFDSVQQQIGYETIRGPGGTAWLRLGVLALTLAVVSALVFNRRLP